MKPTTNGEVIIESMREAHTAHHVLRVYRDNPIMAGEVLDGYIDHGEAYAAPPELAQELLQGLWACVRVEKTSRFKRAVQRLPLLGSHIYDYRQESRRMLNVLSEEQNG